MIVQGQDPVYFGSVGSTNPTVPAVTGSGPNDIGIWFGGDNGDAIAAGAGLTASGTPYNGTAISMAVGWANLVTGSEDLGFDIDPERCRMITIKNANAVLQGAITTTAGATSIAIPSKTILRPSLICVYYMVGSTPGTVSTPAGFTEQFTQTSAGFVHKVFTSTVPVSVYAGGTITWDNSREAAIWSGVVCR